MVTSPQTTSNDPRAADRNDAMTGQMTGSWTVAGVSPATKKAAREAAQRANMTVGEWVEQAIRRSLQSGSGRYDTHEPANPRPNRRYF